MSFGMFEAAVAGDKENEHQKKLAKTRLAQAAAEVDQKLGSFLSKATSKSDYIERVRLAENDFREIVGKYLEGDTGFKAVATKMAGHYVQKVAFTDIKDIRSHVDGLGVKTRKKGDGFTFPAASGATGYIAVRPNGEIVVETLIGGSGGFQSVYAPNEMDLVERWIEKTVGGSYRMSSRKARRKRADDHVDAPGVDMSQTMLDGMSGYGDAVAVAFDSNGNAVDLALNWETAQSMANEGYNMQAIRGDGGMSQDDIQRMVDYEKELRRDLYSSRERRSSKRRVALLPDEFNVDVDSAMAYDAEAGMFVDVQPGGNGYEWNLYWDSGSDYTNVTQDLADSGSAGSLEEAIEQAAHEVSQYSPDSNPFRQSARKRRSNRHKRANESLYTLTLDNGKSYPVNNGSDLVHWAKDRYYGDYDALDTLDEMADIIDSGGHGWDHADALGLLLEKNSSRKRRSNRRTARGVDFTRATYDLFEDGSGDSWYDLVDEDSRSYDSDDLDEVVTWLKQDGLLPHDGRPDVYVADSYEDPYTSQRYEDSAALRGFTDEELHEIKRRMSSRRASRGRRFDRVAGERPLFEDEVDWLNSATPGTAIQSWDPRGGEETEDGDYTGEYIKFVKTKSDKWYNNDYRTDLSAEELAGNEKPFKRSRRQRQAAGTNERFPGTNEMFERAGWQSTDPEKSEWLAPSGYTMYDGSTGSAYYLDDRGIVNSFYTLEDEEFRDDLPQILTDDEEYQSRLWEY